MGIWDGYAEPSNAPTPVPQTAPKASSGGIGGFLYDNFVKPTVDTVTGLPNDIIHGGSALGTVLGSVLQGHHGAQLAQDKQNALNEVNKTSFAPAFGGKTVQEVNAQPVGQQLEKISGHTLGQVANIAALNPVEGGVKALATTGLKLGAAQGASNAMEQGQSGGSVVGNALLGGGTGAVTGGIFGKLAGAPSAVSNAVKTKAANYGANEGLNTRATQAADFANLGKTDLKNAMSYTKGGEPLGLNGVSDHLRSLGIEPNAQNMATYSKFVLDQVGGHLQDMTEGIKVDVGSPADVGRNFIVKNIGTLGGLKAKSGAASDTLQQIRSMTAGVTGSTPAPTVLRAISELDTAASKLSKAVDNGGSKEAAQQGAYKTVADHLRQTLSNHPGINTAISEYKTPVTGAQDMNNAAVNAGLNDQVGNHVTSTIDNATQFQHLKSGMQPAMVARDLAKSADEAAQNTPPKPVSGSGGNGMGDLSSVYEGGAALRGNPVAAATLFAKLGGGLDKLAGYTTSKVAPKSYQGGIENGLKGQKATGTPSEVMNGAGKRLAATSLPASIAANAITQQPDSSQTTTDPMIQSNGSALSDPTMMGSDVSSAGQQQGSAPYSQENMLADIQRDPKHMSDYMALYKQLNPPPSASASQSPYGKPTAQSFSMANSGLQAIGQIRQMLQTDPGLINRGSTPGQNLPIFGGLIQKGQGITQYESAISNALDSLARARTGAAMPASEKQFYTANFLPRAGDTSKDAEFKLQQLEQAFAPFVQWQSNTANSSAAPSYSDNATLLQSLGAQ